MIQTFYFSEKSFNNKEEFITKTTITLNRRGRTHHKGNINIKKVNGLQFTSIDKPSGWGDDVVVWVGEKIDAEITIGEQKAMYPLTTWDKYPGVVGC